MPDTQEQTLGVLFNMCITSSILIGLPIQKAGMSFWVIFTSWLTCCKTAEFGAGKKKEKKKKKAEGGFLHITVTGEKGGFVPSAPLQQHRGFSKSIT